MRSDSRWGRHADMGVSVRQRDLRLKTLFCRLSSADNEPEQEIKRWEAALMWAQDAYLQACRPHLLQKIPKIDQRNQNPLFNAEERQ